LEYIKDLPLKKEFKPPRYNLDQKDCKRKIFRGYLSHSCFFVDWGSKDIIKKKKKNQLLATFSNLYTQYAFLRYSDLFSFSTVNASYSLFSKQLFLKFNSKESYFYIVDKLE
jgi:hypothetical protein